MPRPDSVSGITASWIFPEAVDEDSVSEIASRWKMPPIVARLLRQRFPAACDEGIDRFLNPRFTDLHDPYRMTGMSEAAARIAQAVYRREPVTVLGDYDVDGTTSTALLTGALTSLGVPVEWCIPHREQDGYGLSDGAVERVKTTSGTLVITVDCGVTSVDQIAALAQDGREVIVLDHHEPADVLPDAVAVVDPKRRDCAYPFPGLAAVGVSFKLLQALEDILGIPSGKLTIPTLDLVAVGTAADIVPVLDENRVLLRAGLRRLRSQPRPGLAALMNIANIEGGRMTVSNVVFGIAPRINAAGRMGSAEDAVRLLLTDSDVEAFQLARQLDTANRIRQAQDRSTLEVAVIEAEQQIAGGARALVLADANWHPGVVGIVAARLVEQFRVPAIMISLGETVGRGSGRSIEGFDLHAALAECSDVLVGYGGHVRAAGLSIHPERIAEFRERFQQIAEERITTEMLRPKQTIDAIAELREVDMPLMAELERLGPFGPSNRRPVFASLGVRAVAPPEVLKGSHLKAEIQQHGVVREVIGFGMADQAKLFTGSVDVAYVPEENTFRGETRLQLRLKSVRPAQ